MLCYVSHTIVFVFSIFFNFESMLLESFLRNSVRQHFVHLYCTLLVALIECNGG